MPDSNVVVIPLKRYEELVRTETRVSVLVERLIHSDSISQEDILWILYTELSVEHAQYLHEKSEKEREEWERKYQSMD